MKTNGIGTLVIITPQGDKQHRGVISIDVEKALVEVTLTKNPNEVGAAHSGSTIITVHIRNAIVYWAD